MLAPKLNPLASHGLTFDGEVKIVSFDRSAAKQTNQQKIQISVSLSVQKARSAEGCFYSTVKFHFFPPLPRAYAEGAMELWVLDQTSVYRGLAVSSHYRGRRSISHHQVVFGRAMPLKSQLHRERALTITSLAIYYPVSAWTKELLRVRSCAL